MSREARLLRLVLVAVSVAFSTGAVHRTPNFVVHAPSESIARQVGEAAERYRVELAVEWLGEELPGRWAKPCTVNVKVGQIGAGGATTFSFENGEVFGWRMRVQGTLERILDSVLPHEISHTIFACHFRRPLPRWADEGAATLAEHESEQRRQQLTLKQVLGNSRKIPLRKLFTMTEYPSDMRNVLTLYAEGYSLADFLVQQGGKPRYLRFLEEALEEGWDQSLDHYYGFDSVEALETRWNKWVMAGSPSLETPEGTQLAAADPPEKLPAENSGLTIRAQNAEEQPDGNNIDRRRGATNDNRELSAPVPRSRRTAVTDDSGRGGRNLRRRESSAEKKETKDAAKPTNGRLRALMDGWLPVQSRPANLSTQMEPGFPADSNRISLKQNAASGRRAEPSADRFLPITEYRRGEWGPSGPWSGQPADAGRSPEAVMQPRRREPMQKRSPHWSDFPRPRTGGSSGAPGDVSASPLSPR